MDDDKNYLDEIDLDDVLASLDEDDQDNSDDDDDQDDDDSSDDDSKLRDAKLAKRVAEAVMEKARQAQQQATDKKDNSDDDADDDKNPPVETVSIDEKVDRIEQAVLSIVKQNTDSSKDQFDRTAEAKVILSEKHKKIMDSPAIPGYDKTRREAIDELVAIGKVDQAIEYARMLIKENNIEMDSLSPPRSDVPELGVDDVNRSKRLKKRLSKAQERFGKIGVQG